MTKNKKSDMKAVAAVSAFFVVLAVGAWFVVISPQHKHAQTLGTQIAEVNNEVNARELAVHARTSATTQIQTADLFRLTKAMPDQVDMPDILLELSRVARDTGIRFDSITPSPSSVLGGYQVVPIELVFQGNYYDLADFTYRLRNLVIVHHGDLIAAGRLFSVESLDFGQGDQKFPMIRATLVVDAYVYGAGAQAGLGTVAPSTAAPSGTTSTSTDSTATTTSSTTTTSTDTVPSPTTPPLPPVGASAAGATD